MHAIWVSQCDSLDVVSTSNWSIPPQRCPTLMTTVLLAHCVSAAVGTAAGSCVGAAVVSWVGARVGVWVGAWVGLCVGVWVGAWVGSCVGSWVGACVGLWVRACVGLWVGACVGLWVGPCVGLWVGAWVGLCVGACVGVLIGFDAFLPVSRATWCMITGLFVKHHYSRQKGKLIPLGYCQTFMMINGKQHGKTTKATSRKHSCKCS